MAKDVKVDQLGDLVTMSGWCTVNRQRYAVTVPINAWKEWRDGKVIQEVMPELSADEREFLISKLTPAEFDKIFEGSD